MNYGHYGRDLLLELKRSSADRVSGGGGAGGGGGGASGPALLPSYNDTLVSNALQDLRLHVQALQDQVEAASSGGSGKGAGNKPSMNVRPSILLQNAAIQRNKRCLLAYHVERLHRVKRGLYWEQQSYENKQLCPAEESFLHSYGDLVREYTRTSCGGMLADDDDFLRANAVPPLAADERVQVRVVVPIGEEEVALESGATAVLTTVGSTHYLLWCDVEEYVRGGSLRIVEGEE